MNQDLNRRKDDRHPDQPLQWDDKPDLLAMRAGVSEIQREIERAQREIERARLAGLTMLAMPIETANAACCYVAHLGERVGESVGAAPAEQASKQVPTSVLDLPGAIMNIPCRRADSSFLDDASRLLYKEGHRDARHDAADLVLNRADELEALAGQPAAPVAATEQATGAHHLEPENIAAIISDLREIEDGTTERPIEGRDWRTWAGVLARVIEHLATPADAGAGLTDAELPRLDNEEIDAIWQTMPGGPANWLKGFGYQQFAKAVEDEVLLNVERARLSTPAARPNADCSGDPSNCPDNEGHGCECGYGAPAAPVTAEPVAWAFSDGLERLARVRDGYQDSPLLVVYASEAGDYNVPLYAAPVSPQPAAQVPSRDDVLEDAAQQCEAEKVYVHKWHHSSDGDESYNAGCDDCAAAIRAMKGQPAAAHAAHDQKGGE